MIAAPTAHVITMMPAPSHLSRRARNATTAIVPQGITKRPAPRGRATASAVLRTIPKTTRQPAMPSEYSDASTTGPNPRIVARQGAKIAPPKTVRTATRTRLSVLSTLAGWPSVVARPSNPRSRIPPPRTRPVQTMIFLPIDRLGVWSVRFAGPCRREHRADGSPDHGRREHRAVGRPDHGRREHRAVGSPDYGRRQGRIRRVARAGKLDASLQP